MYEPDEQDDIIGDAMAVGGPAFVEELHWAAMDAAESACPWGGTGAEPAGYRRAWIATARQLVSQRRAALNNEADNEATESQRTDQQRDAERPCRGRDV